MSRKRRKRAEEVLVTTLACGATVEGAARKAGLSVRTVYRRLAEPDFQERLRQERVDLARRAAGLLTAASLESVRTLVELQGAALPPAARLGAARAVIGLGMKLREEADLADRVAELERRLEQADGAADGQETGGDRC
jgi:hypothetical protein